MAGLLQLQLLSEGRPPVLLRLLHLHLRVLANPRRHLGRGLGVGLRLGLGLGLGLGVGAPYISLYLPVYPSYLPGTSAAGTRAASAGATWLGSGLGLEPG